MKKIEIDEEVFAFLQSKATPFVDNPNSVLRRLLLEDTTIETVAVHESTSPVDGNEQTRDTISFVHSVLEKHYGNNFRSKSPFRYMFESSEYLIYFQNFNKSESDSLWYRLRENALRILRQSSKTALVCLTNPSDNLYYEIPIQDLDEQVKDANWTRGDIEVNIDHADRRWREFDWNLEQYLTEKAV